MTFFFLLPPPLTPAASDGTRGRNPREEEMVVVFDKKSISALRDVFLGFL